jgi:GT2 family glycosyltransferase
VDNGSTDGSVDQIQKKYPDIKLICLSENLGFAAANNLGAREAQGQWLCLLNNDAFPEPDWLENLVKATDEYPEFIAFGSKMISAENTKILDGIGDVYHISGLAWRMGYNHPVDTAPSEPKEIFSPNAAAVLYRRDAFLLVGGFSEYFYMYHEDVDLGFRLRLRGYRSLYVPDAVVFHQGSASTGVKSDFAVYHGHRNLVWSYFQNMPGRLLWKYLPAHLLATVIFLGYYFLQGQFSAIFRAKWDALRGLPKVLKIRKQVQATRIASETDIDHMLEHGWIAPYQLGLKARRGTS